MGGKSLGKLREILEIRLPSPRGWGMGGRETRFREPISFVVRNSNGGVGSTSVTSLDTSGNTVGIGTSFIDNVYYVSSAEFISTSVSGIDTTVKRVFVKVDDYASGYSGINTSDFFGSFSWGRIDVTGRTETNSYSAYTESGIGATDGTGISTSTMVVRSNFLKFKNYIV